MTQTELQVPIERDHITTWMNHETMSARFILFKTVTTTEDMHFSDTVSIVKQFKRNGLPGVVTVIGK